MMFFEGFERGYAETSEATIHYVAAGAGEPVLLLHGYPETHVCWHKIAPELARKYRVVCADLRGYGDSSKPEGLPDHANYSKRAMGRDMVELMEKLGHQTFHLVGHDRGARVAHRLTRDHESRVRTLTVLDISPTLKMFESTDLAFATAYYHWFLMLQPAPLPEQMLAGQVPFNILGRVGRAEPDLSAFDRRAIEAYVRAFADPRAVHASCEDYRAAGTIDLEHDRADRGKKIKTPVLALWGARAIVGKMFDCLADWREVADDVSGRAIDCGHFLPEESPRETRAEIEAFIARHEAR
ncbi:MAG: alpha/beta hydrolase [Hyphomicrobiales bacterium]|nr:alpha/beta hydrolase [Hyphomicrobiales bacterium]